MEIDYEHLQRVLMRYGRKQWNCLKTPIEDIVQDTLITVFQKSDEIKDYDRRHLEGYSCIALKYNALNTLLDEHKKGLWIQNSDILNDGRSLYGLVDEAVYYMHDPWIDEFYENKRKRGREYYQKNKERLAERFAAYYQEHKEERREYAKQYNNEHKEYQREYYQKNKERFRGYYQKLKEKSQEIQNEVFEQYGVRIRIEDCKKLVAARNKSEEKYIELLKQYIDDKRYL